MGNINVSSFTTRSVGLARVLINNVGISDPVTTRLSGISLQNIKPLSFSAIWDTGATGSVISPKVVSDCKLKPIGTCLVNGVHGQKTTNVYLVDVWLPNKVAFHGLQVTEGELGDSASVLIGMDIISKGDFAVSNFQGKTTFSFRIPSMAETDYVAIGKAQFPSQSIKIGRNDNCFCGSGKKYKKCCGSK